MNAKLESQVDEIYRLPLDEFTKARNALAKTLSGNDKKDVSSLVKPSVAMSIVNQLYWRDPATYKALVDASEKLRAAHRAALSGKKVDTRAPDELHRTTLEKAFVKAAGNAEKHGPPLTDAVREAVRRTLAALPTDERPGRLTREPPPAGFSLLTGVKPRPVDVKQNKREQRPVTISTGPTREELRLMKLEQTRLKAAETRARKEEEKARKIRQKREREIAKAEHALREAERRLADLKL
jgi:hypothetical protein